MMIPKVSQDPKKITNLPAVLPLEKDMMTEREIPNHFLKIEEAIAINPTDLKRTFRDDHSAPRRTFREDNSAPKRTFRDDHSGPRTVKKVIRKGEDTEKKVVSKRRISDSSEARENTKPQRPRMPKKTAPVSDTIRLNKYISNAGVCSRREADMYIKAGNVTVNGKIVTEMGYQVKPHDEVRFDDTAINPEAKRYVLLNKPKDYITTLDDERGRKTVMELVSNACKERIYPVGRLDRNTTGLLCYLPMMAI
jgi:ribosomal 50S subunit-recycling heat shock protein